MEDKGTTIAEFLEREILIVSRNPLVGAIGLISEREEIIEVNIDRESAAALLWALVQFLSTREEAAP